MDATLQALGGVLLKAVPTLILLLILQAYLKFMFFNPLQQVLKKRREQTEGAREAADASFKSASGKAAEYEAQLQRARSEIYKEQEETRRRWMEEQTHNLDQAREQMHAMIRAAREQLDAEIATAKKDLGDFSGVLADGIANSLLERRAG